MRWRTIPVFNAGSETDERAHRYPHPLDRRPAQRAGQHAQRRRVRPGARAGGAAGAAGLGRRRRPCSRQCRCRPAGLGRTGTATTGTRAVPDEGAGRAAQRRHRATDHARARQDLPGRAGRGAARTGSDRIRLRRSAVAQGAILRSRRRRHRQLEPAHAARCGRRHHAVQLPLHGADVDGAGRAGLRQQLHPEAVGTRPVAVAADRRTVPRRRPAGRRVQRAAGRPRRGRCAARAPGRARGEFRRLNPDRPPHL